MEFKSIQIHHDKTGCIPYFIGEVTGCLHTLPVEPHVISRCISGNQCQTKCICAILVNDFQWINTIAQ